MSVEVEVWRLYDRHADRFADDRNRSLVEQSYLDAMTDGLVPGAGVLDLGCGTGAPIAAYLIGAGFDVTGVDAAETMIEHCRDALPTGEWIVGDMRALDLDGGFGAVVAWDSFFHLTPDDQRSMFPRFASHLGPGGRLLFTSGPKAGEAIGALYGEPLYHASLDREEYENLLAESGFSVDLYRENDPECDGHTVWLARKSEG
jgi:SAM-dependent methyltransferase